MQAFSDIVIGFSLAQLTLSLVVPAHAADLWTHRSWLVAYLWTFGIIGGIWSGHTRLFRNVFVPTRITVVANFIMLASLGLSVYFLQLYMRLTQHVSDLIIISRSYFTVFGIVLLCLGIMYAISLRHRPEFIPQPDFVKAVKARTRTLCMGAGVLAGVVASFFVSKEFAIAAIVAGFAAAAIVARLLARSSRAANRREPSPETT